MADEKELPELPSGFAYFVAQHTFVIHGGGWGIRFEPGVPKPVHHSLHAQALAHGATALNDDAQPQLATKSDPQKDPSSVEYRAAVRSAAESLLAKNDPVDFGGNGKPYVHAWEREIGWTPIRSVRDEIWDAVKTEHITE